jgi:hypothetical protein
MWGDVPGGYRQTINDNIVLVLMIETLEGLKNADAIAKVPGVTALFAASGDLGNFSGYRQGTPDYERAINIVHDSTIKARIRLCGPLAWRDRPDFTCFQAGSETAAIAKGVAAELGPLTNTQAVPRGRTVRARTALMTAATGRHVAAAMVLALAAHCGRHRRRSPRSRHPTRPAWRWDTCRCRSPTSRPARRSGPSWVAHASPSTARPP